MTEISKDIFKAAVLHAAHAPEDMSDEELICSVLKHVAPLIIAQAVADERERCAKIADKASDDYADNASRACMADEIAAAIRASKD